MIHQIVVRSKVTANRASAGFYSIQDSAGNILQQFVVDIGFFIHIYVLPFSFFIAEFNKAEFANLLEMMHFHICFGNILTANRALDGSHKPRVAAGNIHQQIIVDIGFLIHISVFHILILLQRFVFTLLYTAHCSLWPLFSKIMFHYFCFIAILYRIARYKTVTNPGGFFVICFTLLHTFLLALWLLLLRSLPVLSMDSGFDQRIAAVRADFHGGAVIRQGFIKIMERFQLFQGIRLDLYAQIVEGEVVGQPAGR